MVKNPPANARDIGDAGSIHWSGKFPGEGNGYLPGSSPGGSREFEGGDGVAIFGKIHI